MIKFRHFRRKNTQSQHKTTHQHHSITNQQEFTLTSFLYGASSIASTSMSSAIAQLVVFVMRKTGEFTRECVKRSFAQRLNGRLIS